MKLTGCIVLPESMVSGVVHIKGTRITRIERKRTDSRLVIAPGFIDAHLWGDPQRLGTQAARGGTTSFLSTVGPLHPAQLAQYLARWEQQPPRIMGARWLGVHLEGPWIHPRQAGALNLRAVRTPSVADARAMWQASNHKVRLVTLAPEVPNSRSLIRFWRQHRVTVCAGHTQATYTQAQDAFTAGVQGVTHLWNKMGAHHQRRPGLVGATFDHPTAMAMVLVDGQHIHPHTVRLTAQLLGARRMVLASDSTHGVRLTDDPRVGLRRRAFGGLAGTKLQMIEAVRNLVQYTGIDMHDAICMATSNPARLLGIHRHYGRIAVGRRADLVVFDQAYRVRRTMVDGQTVYQQR